MILIRVDLPAPFSPTRACTSPARRSNDTPLSARTPPKLLLIPVSRSNVCTANSLSSSRQHVALVVLDLGEPVPADWHALLETVVVPYGSERQGLGFLQHRQTRRVVAGRLPLAQGINRLEQRQQQRLQRAAGADHPGRQPVD